MVPWSQNKALGSPGGFEDNVQWRRECSWEKLLRQLNLEASADMAWNRVVQWIWKQWQQVEQPNTRRLKSDHISFSSLYTESLQPPYQTNNHCNRAYSDLYDINNQEDEEEQEQVVQNQGEEWS